MVIVDVGKREARLTVALTGLKTNVRPRSSVGRCKFIISIRLLVQRMDSYFKH